MTLMSTSIMDDQDNVTFTHVQQKDLLSSVTSIGSGSLINRADFSIAIRAIECAVMPVFGLFGLPANIINMVVFYRQGLRDKMNLCLFVLACVDFMYLLCMFMTTFHCLAAFLTDAVSEKILQWTVIKITINFRYAFMYCSGALTAIIATERCICVVWPLKSATIFTTKTMSLVILCVIVFFNLLCLPYSLKLYVNLEASENTNMTVVYGDTDLYINNKFIFHIIRDTMLPSISFITFFIVSVVTVVTVRKLKTAMDWRQKTSGNVMDKRQMTLVKILITVSCVYIACNAPKLSLAIVRFLVDEYSTVGIYRNLFFITHRGGFAILMVNSSVNFFIYYRQSQRFRKELNAFASCFKTQAEEN